MQWKLQKKDGILVATRTELRPANGLAKRRPLVRSQRASSKVLPVGALIPGEMSVRSHVAVVAAVVLAPAVKGRGDAERLYQSRFHIECFHLKHSTKNDTYMS